MSLLVFLLMAKHSDGISPGSSITVKRSQLSFICTPEILAQLLSMLVEYSSFPLWTSYITRWLVFAALKSSTSIFPVPVAKATFPLKAETEVIMGKELLISLYFRDEKATVLGMRSLSSSFWNARESSSLYSYNRVDMFHL